METNAMSKYKCPKCGDELELACIECSSAFYAWFKCENKQCKISSLSYAGTSEETAKERARLCFDLDIAEGCLVKDWFGAKD